MSNKLVILDKQYVWHPFTQMRDWLKSDPILIKSGKGSVLKDIKGKTYIDANSSIWTNIHGHNHPTINRAIKNQLEKVAHTSALGFANEPASILAEKLVKSVKIKISDSRNPQLAKVFFSDDGSTAMEVAIKLAYAHSIRSGKTKRPQFLSLSGAYHGDTVGAVSVGHIDLFHKTYSQLLFKSDELMPPYCYRCPYNRAKPERMDARLYRKCGWECVDKAEKIFAAKKKKGDRYAGFIFEPLMQGAAGMIPQPPGWLKRVTDIARDYGTDLIADEVMTGFGRTGTLFACHSENVQPDFMALAKGLTGGYLPMAATLTTQKVFASFLGEYSEFKTFFHGHSFTSNQLGAAAGIASLGLLSSPSSATDRKRLQSDMEKSLNPLWKSPHVGDVRQVGMVAGIEIVKDWKKRESYKLDERAGIRVCDEMARMGVLTRPIGNVIAIIPPYCTTTEQMDKIGNVLHKSIQKVLG
jgi:adenosylmethionine-8-amino-7-oxononanoate transaminase